MHKQKLITILKQHTMDGFVFSGELWILVSPDTVSDFVHAFIKTDPDYFDHDILQSDFNGKAFRFNLNDLCNYYDFDISEIQQAAYAD